MLHIIGILIVIGLLPFILDIVIALVGLVLLGLYYIFIWPPVQLVKLVFYTLKSTIELLVDAVDFVIDAAKATPSFLLSVFKFIANIPRALFESVKKLIAILLNTPKAFIEVTKKVYNNLKSIPSVLSEVIKKIVVTFKENVLWFLYAAGLLGIYFLGNMLY
ncbi:hypothetical protein [uncultured Campylobacter sp.]|jgi:hypothetical protein|uniref:hypothetical protein n=1 Tax=uncultured Campylobacter sp. TaxID=218934 RepID=UPI002628E5E3|nr:hypothetical protein [uncultured Campylobacter sp.]